MNAISIIARTETQIKDLHDLCLRSKHQRCVRELIINVDPLIDRSLSVEGDPFRLSVQDQPDYI